MKVRDLIKRLECLNPDGEVEIAIYDRPSRIGYPACYGFIPEHKLESYKRSVRTAPNGGARIQCIIPDETGPGARYPKITYRKGTRK